MICIFLVPVGGYHISKFPIYFKKLILLIVIGKLKLSKETGFLITARNLEYWDTPTGTRNIPIIRKLDISYSKGILTLGFNFTGMNFPITIDPTLNFQVGASLDDTYVKNATESNNPTAVDLFVGEAGGNIYDSGYRWTGITIEDNSTIDVAYISLYLDFIDSSGTIKTIIYFEDVSSPAQFDGATWVPARTKTTASTTWDINSGAPETQGAFNNSPSIVSIIQELIDTYTYSSGVMAFFHLNNASPAWRYIISDSYDGVQANAAKLHIEYTTGVPPIDALNNYIEAGYTV